MRIAVWHDLPSGGALRALVGQVKMLQQLGHEVRAWSPNSFGLDFSAEWWPQQVPFEVKPFPAAPKASFLDRRFNVPLDLFEWRRRVLHEHAGNVATELYRWSADILFAHPSWWFYASPLALYWAGPSVLYLQEPNRTLFEAGPDNAWAAPAVSSTSLRNRLGSTIRDRRRLAAHRRMLRSEIDWVRSYSRVFVNSLYSRESVLRAYDIDSTFSPLGVDHWDHDTNPSEAKRAEVVSLGEVASHKNPLLAVDAIATIPHAIRPPLNWYANRANDELLPIVQGHARARGVEFIFHAAAPDAEVRAALSRAACFLFCGRLEPLGLAPLEANLAGTAVVAVGEGGLRETIMPDVNGTLVFSREPSELGAAVELYVTDLELARVVGQRAASHVREQHGWQSAGRRLEAELERTIQRHQAR